MLALCASKLFSCYETLSLLSKRNFKTEPRPEERRSFHQDDFRADARGEVPVQESLQSQKPRSTERAAAEGY